MTADSIRFLSPCGMLGYGYPLENLQRGLDRKPDFIGVDAGSTDPGAYYLGSGQAFVRPSQVRRDLAPLLRGAIESGIPLVVGSAGGSGARSHVDDFLTELRQVATRENLHFRMAVVYADIDPDLLVERLAAGRVAPCGPSGELTEAAIRGCSNLVAQMGCEPIARAVDAGAQVVIAGRSCDTAIFASIPIARGFDPALALHAAKIAECGTLCASPGGANDSVLVTLDRTGFEVEPMAPEKACRPDTVIAHSLYEQPDPFGFDEPEGRVDLSEIDVRTLDDRRVRVEGTRLRPHPSPTLKIEGAALRGYRAVTIAGTCDPVVIADLDTIQSEVRAKIASNVTEASEGDDYTVRFLRYGLDAVTGRPLADASPREVGVLIDVVAKSQELADTVVSLARSTALHHPFAGRKCTAGNFAFPFSPSDLHVGPVYDFAVYHLMETDPGDDLFAMEIEDI